MCVHLPVGIIFSVERLAVPSHRVGEAAAEKIVIAAKHCF